jgi:hypothetical protein
MNDAHVSKAQRESTGVDRGRRSLLVTVLLAGYLAVRPAAGLPAPLSFALMGDAPYGDAEVRAFERLIDAVNADESLDFVLHVGDIKGSGEPCSDAFLRARRVLLARFRVPLVFTPGDNEWTDCHRSGAGRHWPLERLQALRRIFYLEPGAPVLPAAWNVERQSSHDGFGEFVENALYVRERVVFATIHVTGSGNDLEPWRGVDSGDSVRDPRADRLAAFNRRQDAARHWLQHAFARAAASNAAGIFIAIHADPHFELPADDPRRAGFNDFLAALGRAASAFAQPVVLAHGDLHRYTLDRPLPDAPNLQRIQVFGSPDVRWIRVTVDSDREPVFMFNAQ